MFSLDGIAFSFGGNQTVVDAAGGNAALLVAFEAGSLTVVDTSFTNFVNASIMYLGDEEVDPDTSVSIASSAFEDNLRGAVVIDRVASVAVSDAVFIGNVNAGEFTNGGGLAVFASFNVSIEDSTFTDNVAIFGGAGMHVYFIATRQQMFSSSITHEFCCLRSTIVHVCLVF